MGRLRSDARRAPRLGTELMAELSGVRAARAATVVDLSSTGCLVRSAAQLDAGKIVDLSIRLPAGAFTCKARVSECSLDGSQQGDDPAYLAGLQFLGVGAQGGAWLREFLAAHWRRPDADAPAR